MSNAERKQNLPQIIQKVESDFNALAAIHGAVHWKRESSFAMQILKNNQYLESIALSNPESLRQAVLNVAAVGLSLSPVLKLAHLVERGKAVCLDIDWRGFVQLAQDASSILWAKAEVVCENDTFTLRGIDKEPLHEFNPFSKEPGKIIGAYCVSKTPDGSYLTTTMSIDEIHYIRDTYSQSWKAHIKNGTSSPWLTAEAEMCKKTVVRRASKFWRKTNNSQRLETALEITSANEPIDVTASPAKLPEDKRSASYDEIREMLAELNRTEEKFIAHLTRVCRREIKKLDDLTDMELSQSMVMLSTWVETERKKKGEQNENAG